MLLKAVGRREHNSYAGYPMPVGDPVVITHHPDSDTYTCSDTPLSDKAKEIFLALKEMWELGSPSSKFFILRCRQEDSDLLLPEEWWIPFSAQEEQEAKEVCKEANVEAQTDAFARQTQPYSYYLEEGFWLTDSSPIGVEVTF